MRFYLDGLLKATSRVYSAAIVSSTNIGDGLCYFGNSRALVNGLNADTGYFLVSDVARF